MKNLNIRYRVTMLGNGPVMESRALVQCPRGLDLSEPWGDDNRTDVGDETEALAVNAAMDRSRQALAVSRAELGAAQAVHARNQRTDRALCEFAAKWGK